MNIKKEFSIAGKGGLMRAKIKRLIKKMFKQRELTWKDNKIKEDYTEYTLSTSGSDNQIYPDFVANAAINYQLFKNFRRSKIYCQIVELTRRDQGQIYVDELMESSPDLLEPKIIKEFKKNDIWGNPMCYDYKNIGVISPTTLRYINVLSDIRKIFPSLDKKSVCEIGAGYGGQCRILSSFFDIDSYTIVDLKPVLSLIQRYLGNYPLNTVIKYKTMHELEPKSYDFILSNYAFAELTKEVQDIYFKKVIAQSKSGYMIYNEGSTPDNFNTYKKEDLHKLIPNNPQIIEEKPLTASKNYVIIWGNTNL